MKKKLHFKKIVPRLNDKKNYTSRKFRVLNKLNYNKLCHLYK